MELSRSFLGGSFEARFVSLLALACAFGLAPSATFAANANNGGNKDRHDDKAARPVGHVVQTVDSEVDQSKLTVGTTLYNGDTITTASDGNMLASLRSSQLAMDPSSQAALELCTDELHVLVYYGTVNFTAAAADHVEFIISQGIVKLLDGPTASAASPSSANARSRLRHARLARRRR